MSRPKGSKNKPKENIGEAIVAGIKETAKVYEEANPVKFTTKADVMPPVPVEQKPWQPKPDMGHIQPPPPSAKVCDQCKHQGAVHYGSEKNWCNLSGCRCQGFVNP